MDQSVRPLRKTHAKKGSLKLMLDLNAGNRFHQKKTILHMRLYDDLWNSPIWEWYVEEENKNTAELFHLTAKWTIAGSFVVSTPNSLF